MQVNEASASYLAVAEAQNVPPGYKKTEVGVIPGDWRVLPMRACLRGSPEYGINAPAVTFDDSLPTYLRITDISEDGRFQPSPRVSVKHPNAVAFYLHEGELVFARTGASVGKSYLYDPNDGPLVFAGFLIRVAPDPAVLVPAFLSYYVQSKPYWDWVGTMSIRSGQPGINGHEYGTLRLPLPEPKEQCAIAEALSDVDGLIAALDKLIAKKRAIKQAAMQHLLTGKTRLPGFSGEWETKRLGTVMKFQVGFPFSSVFFNEEEQGIRLVKNRDLKSDDQIFHYNGKYDPAFLVSDGDVLVGMDGDFLPCLWAKGPALLNQRVGRIVSLSGLNRAFAFYYLLEPLKEIEAATSSTTVKHLSHGDIEDIEKPLPTEAEQTAIATVLSDMDAEIADLEARRDKTRAIKRGMMQQLLTGRVRLI